MKKILCFLLICTSLCILGCNKTEKKLYVGYVSNFVSYEWDLKVSQGAAKRADELGVNIEIGDGALELEKQIKFAQTLIEKGVDVLILSPIDRYGFDEVVKEANAKGIIVIAESVPIKDTLTCVGIDNKKAGIQAGKWFANYGIEKKLDLDFLLVNYSLVNECVLRMDGFKEGYNSIIPLKIAQEAEVDFTAEHTKISKEKNKSVNAIFGINDVSTYDELNNYGENVYAMGFGLMGDLSKDKLYSDKRVVAELATFPEYVGASLIDVAVGAKEKKSYGPYVYTPTTVITKDNYKDFYIQKDDEWIVNFDAVSAL